MGIKKRILIVSHDKSSPGGVSNFISALLGKFSDSAIYDHFAIGTAIKSESLLLKIANVLFDTARLIKTLRGNPIDCIHLNPSLNTKALLRDGLFLLVSYLMGGKKTVVFFHGWDAGMEDKLRNNAILGKLFRYVYSKASLVLVLASPFKTALIDLGLESEKIILFTTMFDSGLFEGIKKSQTRNERKILFLSRLVESKGVFELLEAFKEISARHPDVNLILVGDGPEREKLERYVGSVGLSKRVIMPGYLRGREKAEVLLGSDLFVFPTYYGEGCPVSLLEAMAAGAAVITTKAGGIPDIFIDGKNGILLNEVNPSVISQAIEALLNDQERCSKMKETNKHEAWEKFESSIVTQKLESVYQKVLSTR